MNWDLGAIHYFATESIKFSPLELFFDDIKEKTALNEQHLFTTMNLYKKEFHEVKDKLTQEYKAAMATAKATYNKILEETGDERFASHDSGMDEIPEHFDHREEVIKKRFLELISYFNKSSLVLFYSLLESELRHLCNLLYTIFGKRITLEHLNNNDYLSSIISYLDLVIEIDVADLDGYISKFKEIQYIRNRFVHEGGEFLRERENKQLHQILNKNKDLLKLTDSSNPGYQTLRVQKIKYIIEYYDLLKYFFNDLLWLVEKKRNYSIIVGRLRFLFGFISENVIVRINGIMPTKKGKQITCEIESEEEGKSFRLNCKITMVQSKKDEFKPIDQTDNSIPNLDRMLKYLEYHPEIITKGALGIFMPSNSPCTVSMTVYP